MNFEPTAITQQREPLHSETVNNPSTDVFYEGHRTCFSYDTKTPNNQVPGPTTAELLDQQTEQYGTEADLAPNWSSAEKYRPFLASRRGGPSDCVSELYTRTPMVCCANVGTTADGSRMLETHFYECPDVTHCDAVQGGCL